MNGLIGEPQDVLRTMARMDQSALEDQLCDLRNLLNDALSEASCRDDGSIRQFRLDELAPLAAALWFLFGCIDEEGSQGSCQGGDR